MSKFTKELTAVNDLALAAANEAANSALPEGEKPLSDHEYLHKLIDGVLKSYQDQYIKITAGAFLLRFPAGKVDAIKALAAGGNSQLAEYIGLIETEPFVYTGSTLVRTGVATLVAAKILTQAEADVILA